ncbi:MAG: YHYH protein [Deltaproteobacteria bacterium]|nr:YHYH protein [Deltaproteobacteria bacterium]
MYCLEKLLQENVPFVCLLLGFITMRTIITLSMIALLSFSYPCFGQNKTKIKKDGDRTCITSNGLPNHDTGDFPNAGNPNTISEQEHTFCFPTQPTLTDRAQTKHGIIGIAINGIPMEPGTAEWYNRDRDSGWNYSAIGGSIDLGIDKNNAHVQPSGMYHYHGVPYGLIATLKSPDAIIGYAADGFPIYANYKNLQTSYRLKKGTRPTPPYGSYDGTFVQDWEYVESEGELDACNGIMMGGKYRYVITRDFPQMPRCLKGAIIDSSFERAPDAQVGPHHPHNPKRRPPHPQKPHRPGQDPGPPRSQ